MFPISVSFLINNAEELAALNAAVNPSTCGPMSGEVAQVAAPKSKPESKKETKSAPVKEEPKTDAAQEVTRADVSKLAVALATKGKREDVVSILAEFGAQAVTGSDTKPGLSDEDLAAAHAKLSAVAI